MNRKRTKDTRKPLDNSDVLVAQHRQSSRYLHKIKEVNRSNPRVNSVDEFHVCSAPLRASTCPWQSNTLGHQGCWSIAKPFRAKKDSVTWVPSLDSN
ncbi:hypothetical protein NEUTE2DRAFT_122939 [Neurospora tetrasperma FGSC 2509]|nr:hypothetical protein NEUTE2DRAFT_122939 [Neurospora tetrasperma FGSC 2509]